MSVRDADLEVTEPGSSTKRMEPAACGASLPMLIISLTHTTVKPALFLHPALQKRRSEIQIMQPSGRTGCQTQVL